MTDRRTGAVIVAAGVPDENGGEPLYPLGSISIAERIVATLQQAGVGRIVFVTGYHAERLEHQLSRKGVVFLRNERFETTQMIESARIGLSYLQASCDWILFTPVDIPLFTADTVRSLLETRARLACPVYEGTPGHPILIGSGLLPVLLGDTGEGGLQGAIERCGEAMVRVEVPDPGILLDTGRGEEVSSLLEEHNRQLTRPVVTVSLAREKPFFDEQMALLFHQIEETGSVRLACQRLQISYSSGWNMIRNLESQTDGQLVSRSQGGADPKRSGLTPEGKEFLERFDAYARQVRENAQLLFGRFFEDLL
nr:hypothetical protein [uncultured bacterium]